MASDWVKERLRTCDGWNDIVSVSQVRLGQPVSDIVIVIVMVKVNDRCVKVKQIT